MGGAERRSKLANARPHTSFTQEASFQSIAPQWSSPAGVFRAS